MDANDAPVIEEVDALFISEELTNSLDLGRPVIASDEDEGDTLTISLGRYLINTSLLSYNLFSSLLTVYLLSTTLLITAFLLF